MEKTKLAFYKSLTHFLGKSLGENYEIILHVLDADNFHIAEIENSHISGRSCQSPITGFALELIQSQQHLTKDFIVNYKAQTVNGKRLRGSTFFLKDEHGDLEGMLCINQDISHYEELSREILSLVGLTQPSPSEFREDDAHRVDSVEILEESIEDIIHSIVSPELLDKDIILSKELKLDIIRQLTEKGVFQIKGAVARVADILNISEPSVYRYIKIVN